MKTPGTRTFCLTLCVAVVYGLSWFFPAVVIGSQWFAVIGDSSGTDPRIRGVKYGSDFIIGGVPDIAKVANIPICVGLWLLFRRKGRGAAIAGTIALLLAALSAFSADYPGIVMLPGGWLWFAAIMLLIVSGWIVARSGPNQAADAPQEFGQMPIRPTRRILGLQAGYWLALPVFPCAALACIGMPPVDPTLPKADLDAIAAVHAQRFMVTRDAASGFRLVPLPVTEDVDPLWHVSGMSGGDGYLDFKFGFLRQVGRWYWGPPSGTGPNPQQLSARDVKKIHALVLEDVSRREHDSRPLFEELFDSGIVRTSIPIKQNAVILLIWLSLAMAGVAFVAMFRKPHMTHESP